MKITEFNPTDEERAALPYRIRKLLDEREEIDNKLYNLVACRQWRCETCNCGSTIKKLTITQSKEGWSITCPFCLDVNEVEDPGCFYDFYQKVKRED